MKGRWNEYFVKLMNIKSEDEAIVTYTEMIGGGRRVHELQGIKRKNNESK